MVALFFCPTFAHSFLLHDETGQKSSYQVLELVPIFCWRHTCHSLAISRKMGVTGEMHAVGNAGESKTLIIQKPYNLKGGIIFYPCGGGLIAHGLTYLGEIFRSNAEFGGIEGYIAIGKTMLLSKIQKMDEHTS
jgi:hypothetical protein